MVRVKVRRFRDPGAPTGHALDRVSRPYAGGIGPRRVGQQGEGRDGGVAAGHLLLQLIACREVALAVQ